jgi:hypothetical protein
MPYTMDDARKNKTIRCWAVRSPGPHTWGRVFFNSREHPRNFLDQRAENGSLTFLSPAFFSANAALQADFPHRGKNMKIFKIRRLHLAPGKRHIL